jgi:hypothetical protein
MTRFLGTCVVIAAVLYAMYWALEWRYFHP